MSSRTLTNTAWGEMAHDIADDGSATVTSICKACAGTNVQAIGAADNVFQKVRPKHKAGCRFHPDAQVPQASQVAATVPVVVGGRLPPALIWALIVALIVLAFLGGYAL